MRCSSGMPRRNRNSMLPSRCATKSACRNMDVNSVDPSICEVLRPEGQLLHCRRCYGEGCERRGEDLDEEYGDVAYEQHRGKVRVLPHPQHQCGGDYDHDQVGSKLHGRAYSIVFKANLVPLASLSLRCTYGMRWANMRYRREFDIVECQEVYPPSEDTFLLLEALEVSSDEAVLEMGPGTGLITCHLLPAPPRWWPPTSSQGGEVHRCEPPSKPVAGRGQMSDLFQNVPERFDVIVFNPPTAPGPNGTAWHYPGRRPRAWGDGRFPADA